MVNQFNRRKLQTVVISQSMYFPWCGLIDQIRLSDVFVHYDDVQLSRGFYNRVQVKNPTGFSWLTIPIQQKNQKQNISNSIISYHEDWVARHRSLLVESYRKTKFIDEAISLFDRVHTKKFEVLSDLGRATIVALAEYFDLNNKIQFVDAADLISNGERSRRLCDIVLSIGGTVYLTGHGALNYLDHSLFELNGVEVRYMDYNFHEYSQLHGAFTPYVTALDAVAHLGVGAKGVLASRTQNWRKAVERPDKLRARICREHKENGQGYMS